jgi:hypothetical protein
MENITPKEALKVFRYPLTILGDGATVEIICGDDESVASCVQSHPGGGEIRREEVAIKEWFRSWFACDKALKAQVAMLESANEHLRVKLAEKREEYNHYRDAQAKQERERLMEIADDWKAKYEWAIGMNTNVINDALPG